MSIFDDLESFNKDFKTQASGPAGSLSMEKIQQLADQLGPPPKRLLIIVGYPLLSTRGAVFKMEGKSDELWFIHPEHRKLLWQHASKSPEPTLSGVRIEQYHPPQHDQLIAQIMLEALPPQALDLGSPENLFPWKDR